MFWNPRPPLSRGEQFRLVHERWLNWAVAGAAGAADSLPRIPRRRVDEGGFSRFVTRAGGREWADRWWAGALERVKAHPPAAGG